MSARCLAHSPGDFRHGHFEQDVEETNARRRKPVPTAAVGAVFRMIQDVARDDVDRFVLSALAGVHMCPSTIYRHAGILLFNVGACRRRHDCLRCSCHYGGKRCPQYRGATFERLRINQAFVVRANRHFLSETKKIINNVFVHPNVYFDVTRRH